MNTKKYTKFRPEVRTRHASHSQLRRKYKRLPLFPFRSVIRLGSSTQLDDSTTKGGKRVELNTVDAISNSSNKRTMKTLFHKNKVPTPIWQFLENVIQPRKDDKKVIFSTEVYGHNDSNMEFPVVVKRQYGSRGKGNTKINDITEFYKFFNEIKSNERTQYIIEKFYNYNREYRVHVNEEGGFYFLRKMLKTDTPNDKRWFRNDSNSVWILDNNEAFDTPTNIKEIEKASVASLKAVGLDFGAVDVRVQSSKTVKGNTRKQAPLFTIIEINSAPSFGEITRQKYIEEIPKMLYRKHSKLK